MVAFDVEEAFDYTQYSNRQLVIVPLVILVLAILIISGWYLTTGSPVNPGIEFTGGTEIHIQTSDSQGEIAAAFEEENPSIRPVLDTEGSTTNSFILTFQPTDVDALESKAESAGYEIVSIQSTSASFGGDTQILAMFGVIAAFVGMSLLVFVLFRTFIPSIAVVLSAFSDVVIPIALMNIFNIQLTLGTVAALLMIIGYSVDSDILLNNHVLRRSGGFYESAYDAMRTGVTMTVTSLSAVFVMTVVSFLFGIELLSAIGTVLVFGLLADLMNTYLLNMSLLRWYRKVEV